MRKLVVLFLAAGLAVASNFYIFYKQVGVNPHCPGLSVDAANNASSHRKWTLNSNGTFSEDDTTRGDWLIRAVLDWTPQDTNASAVWFASNMPVDTLTNINFQVKAVVKNMGTDTLPLRTPVRLSIAGPSGYVYNDTEQTTVKLAHRGTTTITFAPAWHVPNMVGKYNVMVWVEAAGERWKADDSIFYDFNADWIQYHTDAQLRWVTWAAPERAVKFHPASFGAQYPVRISRVRSYFSKDTITWRDTSFTFKIYSGDGQTLLYQSETLEAIPNAYKYCSLGSPVVIDTGDFYVSVVPVDTSGKPTTAGDSSVGGHSFWGSPGLWYNWPGITPSGDLFISAAVQSGSMAGSARWVGPGVDYSSQAVPARPAQPPERSVNSCAVSVSLRPIDEAQPSGQADVSPGAEAEVLPSPSSFFPAATDTLKYDIGTPLRGWADSVAGSGRGVKFIGPADSFRLTGALVHIYYASWPAPGDTWASFRVYKDDGGNGAPGTLLYAVDSVNIKRGAWNFIPLSTTALQEGPPPGLNGPSLRITNYPNPVADQVTFRWQVPVSMPVSVNLYDATGRMVRNLCSADGRTRSGTFTVDTRSLAAGIYLVRLETAGGSVTRKVVIGR